MDTKKETKQAGEQLFDTQDIKDGGYVIDDWVIYLTGDCEQEYIEFVVKGASGKEYKVQADIVSVEED